MGSLLLDCTCHFHHLTCTEICRILKSYRINPQRSDNMARIDIRDIDDETLKQLDEQCKKYGINSRSDYIRMLIKLDIMTNMVQRLKVDSDEQ